MQRSFPVIFLGVHIRTISYGLFGGFNFSEHGGVP